MNARTISKLFDHSIIRPNATQEEVIHAALQAAQAGEAPTLIRFQTKAGHGFGKSTAILIEELADTYAFLSWALGM